MGKEGYTFTDSNGFSYSVSFNNEYDLVFDVINPAEVKLEDLRIINILTNKGITNRFMNKENEITYEDLLEIVERGGFNLKDINITTEEAVGYIDKDEEKYGYV